MKEFEDFEDTSQEGLKKAVDRCYSAYMSERRIRPAVVHDRANEAKEDYLAAEIPGALYRLMRDDIATVWGLMESPIEQVAIFQLASENYGKEDWPIYAKVARARGLHDFKNYPVQIIPQVEFGRFRVDFLIDLGPVGLVAIECDGAEFHQDFAKDSRRSDALKKEFGVVTYRLTGKDIWRGKDAAKFWADMIRMYLAEGTTDLSRGRRT